MQLWGRREVATVGEAPVAVAGEEATVGAGKATAGMQVVVAARKVRRSAPVAGTQVAGKQVAGQREVAWRAVVVREEVARAGEAMVAAGLELEVALMVVAVAMATPVAKVSVPPPLSAAQQC